MPQVSEAKTPAQDKRATKSQRISNYSGKAGKEPDVLFSPLESETLSPIGELSIVAKKFLQRVNRKLLDRKRQKTKSRTYQQQAKFPLSPDLRKGFNKKTLNLWS